MIRISRLRDHGLLIPIVVVTVHAILVFANLWFNALVVDEPYHIASGLSHYQEWNFRADQVNPPLARMIAVAPLLAESPAYDRGKISDEPGARSEWAIGTSWVERNGAAVIGQTRRARLAGIGWSILGAILLYRLVRRHCGRSAATLALSLWCFDPTIVALAAVCTADLPAAVAALGAAAAYDDLLRSEEAGTPWLRRLHAGLWLGVALLTKFTLLILPIYWLAWGLGRRLGRSQAIENPRSAIRRASVDWLIVCGIAVGLVNLGYGFQGSLRTLGNYRFVSQTFAGPLAHAAEGGSKIAWGNRFQTTLLGKIPVPFPEDFILGVDVQRRDFEQPMISYLNGHWSDHGWWWFYIYAIEIKEPMPWLCLLGWAILRRITLAGSRTTQQGISWMEGLGLTLFVFVSAQTGFSHHLRYVVPAYPFMMLFVARNLDPSRAVPPGGDLPDQAFSGSPRSTRWPTRLQWILMAWLGGEAIFSTPYSLSYYNSICGGSRVGHRFLLYSNTDWGQGLLRLKSWIDDHPSANPLYVSYQGPISPKTLGIHAAPVPLLYLERRKARVENRRYNGPEPGYYAISAVLLHSSPDDYGYLDAYEPITSLGGSIFIYHFETKN